MNTNTEKQPTARIFEIKRFAVHDGNGIRTTVFFKGCPLKCVWCHNPEGLAGGPQLAYYENKCVSCGDCTGVCPENAHVFTDGVHTIDREKCIACGKCTEICPAEALMLYGKRMTADDILPVLLEDADFYRSSGGGVTLSGGECLLQADFCAELLKKLKEHGVSTAVDTCGDVPEEAILKVLPYTDIFLYDLKAVDEDVHIRCTGRSNKRILENLRMIDASGASSEIRYPYVPGCNDNQAEPIAAFLSGLRHITGIRVLPYHNYAGSKYRALDLENTLPLHLPDAETVERIQAFLSASVPFASGPQA